MTASRVADWHAVLKSGDPTSLHALLAEDACFHSPVVHRPQQGRELTALYLGAAFRVFAGTDFRYVREIVNDSDACLEFTATIDGIVVNGVDLIHWNAEGRISERPRQPRAYQRGEPATHHHLPATADAEASDLSDGLPDGLPPDVAADLAAGLPDWAPPEDAAW